MGARENKIGKEFEQATQDLFTLLKQHYHLTFIRLYDTKSARGAFLPEQPGDFIVSANGKGHLVECKTSEKHASLRGCLSSNVSTGQAAAHRLWSRSGSPCWFLFLDYKGDMLEIWDGELVGRHRASGKVLPADGTIIRQPLVLYRECLIDLFEL